MTLSERGQIYITLAAGQTFAAHAGLQIEEARRRLAELLLDARLRPDGTWRRRNRTNNVDITAHVIEEGGLQVVTHVHCRDAGPKRSERPNHGYRKKAP